ncbi:MAG: phosphatase [Atopobiaceae bacterium]|jgi:exopolyphosphatase/guanosine-5'-triphosphate,3'-diphosphate pyrophosphatase|nr:phosphatase [Atopobiaceae bacterium]MCH4181310.1 phosphatase [Atopobiaceae bacterium]MCH4215075.1 phosphatase [Atopobiaceae bacterium]MCH4230371.1 phosphatase [Atopobiaceae bacterium]MCH4276774.1 phosphatase [Atopobiaceae bacterium]
MSDSRRVAVIDIGTVTARLGVADVSCGKVLRRTKTSTICNLGEDVARTGRLCDAACGRVLSCVSGYLDGARAAGATSACCTLTSAARDASNAQALLGPLSDLGIDPQVIPGAVEGSLTFLGVAQDFPGRRILVADSGGGSTELAIGTLGPRTESGPGSLALEWVRSVDVGCRRVSELYLSNDDPPSSSDVAAARDFARSALAADLSSAPSGPAPEALVCVGGTVTSLVAIDAALDPYDSTYVHLHELGRPTLDRLTSELAHLTLEERACLVGLEAKRAPVILGGSVVIQALMDATSMDGLTVSESDLLVGLALVAAATADGDASPVGWAPELVALG